MPKTSMLIITTDNDPSIDFFKDKNAISLISSTILRYDAIEETIDNALKNNYQFVYFRDPFNVADFNLTKISRLMARALNLWPDAYYIDGVKNIDQMMLEDKWLQFQKLSKFMPDTRVLGSFNHVDFNRYIIKKRISSRSKGIILVSEDVPKDAMPSDYIYQSKINVEMEYRVYVVGGEIVMPIAVKSTKTNSKLVKIIDTTSSLPSEVASICKYAHKKLCYDFMGLDIVKNQSGYFLLEANRSCQFTGYFRYTSINLATKLNQFLINK